MLKLAWTWTNPSSWICYALIFLIPEPHDLMLQTLLSLDARLTARLRLPSEHSRWWAPAVFLAHSGDSWLWMSGFLLLWLVGNPPLRRWAVFFAVAVGIQALSIFALKQTIRRQRPPGEWGTLYRNFDPHSFPSGHATRAFLLAVLAAGNGPTWLSLVLAFWAPLVSLARVATGVHYLSDIAAGAILGLLMGGAFLAAQPTLSTMLSFLF
ncbi:phosphatase PAP2 family protein [Anaerolinea thermolimosa]|uniref:phosphatase PAP2 family protein n=1 Tax=Anaerolinea thermolimosa TaxID=229919 RepID=UPI0023519847|nr:phosphatase PAP2 family protein [Anaerolinea thermolimosa]